MGHIINLCQILHGLLKAERITQEAGWMGTLRAYDSTITNSFADEPVITGTLSGVVVSSHISTKVFTCKLGAINWPIHLISTYKTT